MSPVGWAKKFDEPIPLPKGKPLVTLRDAALAPMPPILPVKREWRAAVLEAADTAASHWGA